MLAVFGHGERTAELFRKCADGFFGLKIVLSAVEYGGRYAPLRYRMGDYILIVVPAQSINGRGNLLFAFEFGFRNARPEHHIFNEPLHIDYRRLEQRLFKRHCVIGVERKICADTARIEADPLPICECVVGYSPEIGYAAPYIASLRVSTLTVLGQVKAQRLITLCFGYCGEAFGIFLAAHLAVDMDIDFI